MCRDSINLPGEGEEGGSADLPAGGCRRARRRRGQTSKRRGTTPETSGGTSSPWLVGIHYESMCLDCLL